MCLCVMYCLLNCYSYEQKQCHQLQIHKHQNDTDWANNVKGTYAAGHNSFFKSPDGSQHWILYHANSEAGQGCGKERAPRMQPFTFAANGTPVFGNPLPLEVELSIPKGN